MRDDEIKLLIEFTKIRKSDLLKKAPVDLSFIRFMELNCQPNVIHKPFPFLTLH